MPDNERPSEETIIRGFLLEWGEEAYGKHTSKPYFKIDLKSYPEAINSLMVSFIDAGYVESDLDSSVLLRKIQEAMTPEVHDTQKLKDWRDIIAGIWEFNLIKRFGRTDLIKPAREYPKQKPKLKAVPTGEELSAPNPTPEEEKFDPDKFKGFGEAQIVDDEDFVKILEAMKDER